MIVWKIYILAKIFSKLRLIILYMGLTHYDFMFDSKFQKILRKTFESGIKSETNELQRIFLVFLKAHYWLASILNSIPQNYIFRYNFLWLRSLLSPVLGYQQSYQLNIHNFCRMILYLQNDTSSCTTCRSWDSRVLKV